MKTGVIYRSERLLVKNLQFIIVMENLEFAISKKNTLEQKQVPVNADG